ncbi:MAG TPA: hypothetical protein PKK26_02800 [Candidatus Wallbacteria bacterium]|nr:hypothetical protein [Candidatus Wallbacteria bacterium]
MINAVNITKTYEIGPYTELVANIKDGGCLKFATVTNIKPSKEPITGSGIKINVLA